MFALRAALDASPLELGLPTVNVPRACSELVSGLTATYSPDGRQIAEARLQRPACGCSTHATGRLLRTVHGRAGRVVRGLLPGRRLGGGRHRHRRHPAQPSNGRDRPAAEREDRDARRRWGRVQPERADARRDHAQRGERLDAARRAASGRSRRPRRRASAWPSVPTGGGSTPVGWTRSCASTTSPPDAKSTRSIRFRATTANRGRSWWRRATDGRRLAIGYPGGVQRDRRRVDLQHPHLAQGVRRDVDPRRSRSRRSRSAPTTRGSRSARGRHRRRVVARSRVSSSRPTTAPPRASTPCRSHPTGARC